MVSASTDPATADTLKGRPAKYGEDSVHRREKVPLNIFERSITFLEVDKRAE